MRFYLDFCKKYRHGYADPASLALFVENLKSKKQNSFQQDQASAAVGLYYSGLGKHEPDNPAESDSGQSVPQVAEEKKTYAAARKNAPWDRSLETLANEISVRHYTKKTLKSYALWAAKLRYFVKNKDPEALDTEGEKRSLRAAAPGDTG
ncbi:MAG: hypothetical protein SWC96_00040 [Thermodesulfobacteriota bacterium]|nr:hypothetical protein [Thermodesulfobacteriota bacterium]